jgi:hypothetical protein
VVVGDAKEVHDVVAKYGTVELFNAEGKAEETKPEAAPAPSK